MRLVSPQMYLSSMTSPQTRMLGFMDLEIVMRAARHGADYVQDFRPAAAMIVRTDASVTHAQRIEENCAASSGLSRLDIGDFVPDHHGIARNHAQIGLRLKYHLRGR